MKKIAMILDGRVDCIALWDGEDTWNPGPQYILVDVTELDPASCQVGFTYNGTTFIKE